MSITEDLQMKKAQYLSRFLALGLYFKHIELMTVNLLSVTSVVRIHLLPPKETNKSKKLVCLFFIPRIIKYYVFWSDFNRKSLYFYV